MEKFKDILAWIIVVIVLVAILGALGSGIFVLIQALFSAGLGTFVWLIGLILVIFVISRIASWAFDRVI